VSGAPEKQVPSVPGLWRVDLTEQTALTLNKAANTKSQQL
jgi:hypothetical protein